ncbi:MAG: hypothetical protein ABR576_03855 [Thermoanaerobaculia bacterium]
MSIDVQPAGGARRDPLALAALFVAAGALFWIGLGMHRGLLLSNDVKSMSWPWAPGYAKQEIVAPALSDPVWHFVPWLEFARKELAAGRLPLWNPHQDGGVPLLGNAQSGLGAPLLWPVLLFGTAGGWNLSLLLRLLLAFGGMVVWQRDLGRSPAAATLAGLVFALSGPFLGWLEHLISVAAAAVPLLLFFIGRLARRASRGSAAGCALATYLVLSGGHPETSLMAALLAGAHLLYLKPPLRRAGTVLASAAIGAGLAAPFLVPFFEYFFQSEARLGIDRAAFVLPAADLLRFLTVSRPGSNVIEGAATVSVTALLLASASLLRWRDGETRFWLIVAAVCLLVTYENPIARFLSAQTPVYWTRALVLLPIALGSLAAGSWDWLLARVSGAVPSGLARAVAALPVAAVAVELLLASRGVHGSTDSADLSRTPPILRRLQADPEIFHVLPLHTFLPPNTATQYGLDDLRGYDALAPAGWRRRRERIGRFINVPTQRGVLEPWDIAPGGEALDHWNVKYLLLHPGFAFGAETLNARRGLDLREVYSGPDGKLLENRRVLPRVRITTPGTVRLLERRPARWLLETDSPESGEVLVASPFFPGWGALVDGARVTVRAAPGDPIRFSVPAGKHEVELVYRPASFRIGVGTALLSLLAALVLVRRLR